MGIWLPPLLGSKARGETKRAGTTLYQGYNREAENALVMPETVNPGLSEAYRQAGQDYGTVANRSGDDLQQTARGGYEDVMGQTREANAYLDPYVQGGGRSFQTLSDLAQAPEERFTGTNLEMDPGYQFRLAEGTSALQKSAAMRGGLQGGGTLKALTKYAQGAASQEYANAFARSLDTFKTNQASRQQRLNTLGDLSRMGYGAAGQSGQNLTNAAQFGATLTTNAAGRAGDWRNQAAREQGQWGINSATDQANVAMRYGDMARNLRLGGDQASANARVGSANITSNMWAEADKRFQDAMMLAFAGG